jgi:hypothetical protein
MNVLTVVGGYAEKLTMQGELQFGRVPVGRSSALRTAAGMSMVQGQGDARPERMLRRFFMMLTEVWAQIHELNKRFLPPNKTIRILGPDADPAGSFMTIAQAREIDGRFDFGFSANAFNTSKSALQQALKELMGVYITPLAMQLGITKPDGAYRLLRDYGEANGQDPHQYLTPPSPGADGPILMAEEAIAAIMNGNPPRGLPAEGGGAREHLEKLLGFMNSDEFGLLKPSDVGLFKAHLMNVRELAATEEKQKALLAAAQQFQQGQTGKSSEPQGKGGEPPPTDQPPQISGNDELIDETLPGAGGGGAAAQQPGG